MKPTNARVVFRTDKDDGTITAVLPDFPANPGHYLCYAHIGQHGECSLGWYYQSTRPAKPAEYADLLTELTQIYGAQYPDDPDGYKLRVLRRIMRSNKSAS